jgi:hypothetical protein
MIAVCKVIGQRENLQHWQPNPIRLDRWPNIVTQDSFSVNSHHLLRQHRPIKRERTGITYHQLHSLPNQPFRAIKDNNVIRHSSPGELSYRPIGSLTVAARSFHQNFDRLANLGAVLNAAVFVLDGQ